MPSVPNNTSLTLNGKTPFTLGGESFNWGDPADPWIHGLFIGPQGGQKGFKFALNFTGTFVQLGIIRFSGGAEMKVTVKDTTTAGKDHWLDALILSHGGSNVTLTNMSMRVLSAGRGDDVVKTGAGFIGQVQLGIGNNKVTTGTGWIDSITAGDGNDQATIGKGGAGQVLLNHGDNRVTTGDGWFDSIATRDGDDVATIGKAGGGSVNLGHGDNVVKTSKGRVESIFTYSGDDVVTIGGGGADFVSIGNGNDRAIVLKQSKADYLVTIQGGPGSDTIDFSNLKRAIEWDAGNGFTESREGAFLAMSFENVIGTAGSDELGGNNAANTINGGKGGDRIAGHKGADDLIGGGGRDTFVFHLASDSTVGAKGRDLILDFSKAQKDRIDLSDIRKFKFIGDNAFSKTAGEVRFERDDDSTMVLADINGDAKADLAVELDGSFALTKGDFIL